MAVDVFLVEDLKSIQSAMSLLLQGLGDFRIVASVATEAEAIAWLEQNPGQWQLAVIDLMLEQGSGMGVIGRCRRTSPHGKVVVFSGFVSPGIRAHCLRLGADAAFDKNTELGAFTEFCLGLAPPTDRPLPRN